MANDCAACCKNITSQYLTCSQCKGNYHPECVNKDMRGLSKSAIHSWVCLFCLSKVPKTDNTHTPVRPQGPASGGSGADASKANVTLRPQNRESEKRSQLASALPKQAQTVESDALTALTKEIKLLRDDMVEVKNHLKKLTTCVTNCAARLDEFEAKQARTDAKIRALEEKELENAILHQKVTQLEEMLNMQSQNMVRNEIEIQGINEHTNENLFHIVKVAATKIGMELMDSDIDYVSRVGPRRATVNSESPLARPVVLRFVRHMKRQEFLKAAKTRRNITSTDIEVAGRCNKLFFNERLSKQNRNLFRQARLQKATQGYKYCWISNGHIFIRKSEGGPAIAIRGEADLDRIRQPQIVPNSATPVSSATAVDSSAGETFRADSS